MKAMSIDTVYLSRDTIQPGTPVDIIKLPFSSLVFVANSYCGLIRNDAIKDHFIKI